MKLLFKKEAIQKVKADTVVVFLHEDKALREKENQALLKRFGKPSLAAIESGDFKGKLSEIAINYLSSDRRLFLAGLGEKSKVSLETLRRAAAGAVKRARKSRSSTIAFEIPQTQHAPADTITALGEGTILGLYRFDKYLTKKEESGTLEQAFFCSEEKRFSSASKSLAEAQIIAEATIHARDLANAPGNEIYPETLAKAAEDAAERCGFEATILDEGEIESLGMGGVMGVSRGSSHPPRFIILEYGKSSSRTVVLVGKGVTFDTGGISIKPSAGMAEMKMDMSGAAAVMGTFEAAAGLKLPVHLVGLIPAVENMPGGNSFRPGDILRHYNGKTSEVDNTDAEGRLILADALAYAERYKPSAVIDLATLTGACVVALGHYATGMMGNDAKLMEHLKAAGEKTYERVWELPLYDEYEKLIKSDVADVKNVGGRWAGAITAAWFLKKFIGDYRWAHLDIAGTAILEEAGDYAPKGGSGIGVRLLTEFLRHWK